VRLGAESPEYALGLAEQSYSGFRPRHQVWYIGRVSIHPADLVGPVLEAYPPVIEDGDEGRATWRKVREMNELSVTRGTLQLV